MAAEAGIFIGRQTEISALRATFDYARTGNGRLALIAGEPGIGKTRIAQELANHATRHGARAVWGRCLEEPGAPPYWPWAQTLRAVAEPLTGHELTAALGTGASEVASIVPDIAARLPDLPTLRVLSDPAEGRFRLFGAIARFLNAAARAQPLVLILDDLHWADVPSLRLLEFVAQDMADSRLLALGTYRETELSRRHRLSDTLGALSRVPHLLRLPLSGLNAEDVRRYVAATANLVPPESLISAIHNQTEGNPLFVREVVRFLAQNGQLNGGGGAIRLPEGVREVIGRRLNLLSQTCNDILAIAAVIGRGFSLDVLLKACQPRAGDAVLESLDEALAAHIVEETGTNTFQFAHALVRLTLYEELRIGQRRRLHHAAAEAIEAVHRRDLESVAADLAFHFRASGLSEDIDRAIEHATAAARRADKALAFEDTIGFCQNALDLLDTRATDDPGRRCGLLLLLGEAQRKTGDLSGASETLETGAELARVHGLSIMFGELVLAYCYTSYRKNIFVDHIGAMAPRVEAMLSAALERLTDADTSLRIRIMALMARVRYPGGARPDALVLATRAVTMARALGDPAVLAMALYTAGTLKSHDAHELDQALAETAEILALAEATGQIEYAYVARARLTSLHLERGDLGSAKAALALIDRTTEDTYKRLFLGWTATFALMRGELAATEHAIVQSMRTRGGEDGADDPLSILIFVLRRDQGRLGEFRPLVSLFARQTATPVWRPGLALMWLELGETAAARAVFEDAAGADFADLPRDGRWSASIAFLAEVCAALGDTVRAAGLYRLLLPWADHNIVLGNGTGCYGSAHRFLGMLAAATGDRAGAARHFDAAVAMNERIEAWLPVAHTRCDHAALLLDGGDRPGATRLLDLAADAADRLGLPAVANRVAASRARLEVPASPAAVPDALTARELDVLRLLAIGRSNADVALVLDISLNTVATHVRNILAKTGCANRTEAGAYAVRHGLARLA